MTIKTQLIPNTWISIPEHDKGYANGYIGVPAGHPWFGKHYDDIDVDVHGGLTYSGDHCPRCEPDGHWWFGFDTLHYQDNSVNCDETYCRDQVQHLVEQAQKAV